MEIDNDSPCMSMYGFPTLKTKQNCLDMLNQFFPPELYRLDGTDERDPSCGRHPGSIIFEIRQTWRGNSVRSFCGVNWSVIYFDICEICNDYVASWDI